VAGAVHKQTDNAIQSIGVSMTHKRSPPPTKVNSLFVFDEVYFKGEFIIGKAYEIIEATSIE